MHQPTLPAHLCAEVAHLLATTLTAEPPRHRRWIAPTTRSNIALGGYMLAYGYITPAQLIRQLARQRAFTTGAPPLLGDLLVAQQLVSPRVLATMLTVQLLDRMLVAQPYTPAHLGEQLVATGQLRPAQLFSAIQLQTWLRHQGTQIGLGDLLIQQSLVPASTITSLLRTQPHTQAEHARAQH